MSQDSQPGSDRPRSQPPAPTHVPVLRPGLGDGTGRVIIEADPGDLKGWLEYRYGPGDTVEVVNIEVDTWHRRRGVGSRLLERLGNEVRSTLSTPFTIYGFTRADNRIAQEFYAALGFALLPVSLYPDGAAYLFSKTCLPP